MPGRVADFLESRNLIAPNLAVTRVNKDLMSPHLLFYCIYIRRSFYVGSLRKSLHLKRFFMALVTLVAIRNGEMIFSNELQDINGYSDSTGIRIDIQKIFNFLRKM